MVYQLTATDLHHYHFSKRLLALIKAIREVHGPYDTIAVTIDITSPTGGSYALSYTDKGRSTNAK